MKRKIKLMILFLCTLASTQAQDMAMARKIEISENKPILANTKSTFQFMASSEVESVKNITEDEAGTHFLGHEIAKKEYLYNQRYSYKEPVAPDNSATKTIFRKPEIYSSIRKIEKYLKKQVKEGKEKTEVARNQYDKVLDVALNILDVDTENFEKRLKSAGKDAGELLEIYLNEVKLEYID